MNQINCITGCFSLNQSAWIFYLVFCFNSFFSQRILGRDFFVGCWLWLFFLICIVHTLPPIKYWWHQIRLYSFNITAFNLKYWWDRVTFSSISNGHVRSISVMLKRKFNNINKFLVCQVVKIADKSLFFQAKKLVRSFCYLLKSALLFTHSAWKSNYCVIKWMREKQLNQL